MDPSTWKKIEDILDNILELSIRERKTHLESLTIEDEIRTEILQLLEAEKHIPEMLDSGINEFAFQSAINSIASDVQQQRIIEIDRYTILEEIGRGGMSVVYKARRTDGEFDHFVAVKIIQPFGLNRDEQMNRLRAERQILANLQHPNIARVFDGGVTPEGWPYMVMELVDGVLLTQFCREHKLGLNERLGLFLAICNAVSYAHQNLVLHRDLKPGNILVTKNGQVKLLDFGIARLLDDEISTAPLTRTGKPLLTPEYAAPEQFKKGAASTAIDVYSLGVILYELLAGTRPFDFSGKSAAEIEQLVCEQEPERPSERVKRPEPLKGDLDIICLKALRKEPEHRYPSVRDLSEDIIRYCTGNPISARRSTIRYRTRKFIQRHRSGVASAAIFLLVLTGFIALLINQQAITAQERDRAVAISEQVQAELERSNTLRSFLVQMFRANIPNRPQDELPTTEQLLEAGVQRAMDPESGDPAIRADMLTVIASIYETQNRLERALELTEKAIELVEDDSVSHKNQLVAAWHLHSRISLRQRNINQAEESLLKSYNLLPPERMTSDNELRLALDIARIRMQHGEYVQAERLLQPHIRNVLNGIEYQPGLVNRLLWDVGVLYNLTHEFEKSLEARIALNAHSKNLHGATSLDYTVSLANTALTQVQLGLFSEAEETLNEVLALYNEIFDDQPSEYRGAALHTLARLQRYSGRFDEALNTALLSSQEWAAATERENLDEYVWLHFNQAEVLVAGKRWDEAKPVLEHTQKLLADLDPPRYDRLSLVEANLARIHCQSGEISLGIELLSGINRRLEIAETDFMSTDDNLAFYQADGVCASADGRFEDAIASFNSALDLPIPPGQFATSARLKVHLATALNAIGQLEFAMQHLNEAEQFVQQHNAGDHPYMGLIEHTYTTLPATTLTQIE